MYRILLITLITIVVTALAYGQEIPAGVNYKHATDSVNAAAEASLKKLLTEPGKAPAVFAKSTIVVGPMLWREMEPIAEKSFREAEPLILMIPAQKPIMAQGRRMLTDARREAFWAALWRLHPELKDASVRKAKAKELSYFWATIPFDIQEPFFTLDTGKQQFIVNIIAGDKNAGMFWIDVVGDFATLAERNN